MRIGIVGHGTKKFTPETEKLAKDIIRKILLEAEDPIMVSGHSPVGGIDIWAEEIAVELGIPMDIKALVSCESFDIFSKKGSIDDRERSGFFIFCFFSFFSF